MEWKDLAIRLAKTQGHETWCPFEGCACGSVDARLELIAEVFNKQREEEAGGTKE